MAARVGRDGNEDGVQEFGAKIVFRTGKRLACKSHRSCGRKHIFGRAKQMSKKIMFRSSGEQYEKRCSNET
jgi:hypothetical protein